MSDLTLAVSRFSPEPFAGVLHVRQVEAQVELELVVLRLHPAAQFIEGLVVVLLLQVGGLTHKKYGNGHPKCLIFIGTKLNHCPSLNRRRWTSIIAFVHRQEQVGPTSE